ncbi:hypothetical protein BDY21DRAFT_391151 [Lineolata rhizophorae]|uniref:Uncharacterized protein n=1 Tax=Lineolata rhizophorae TaxID=578093 RepID=A0A6A6P023_9PEZI|nr:hypothetical protein BDY21DRAFT_391151 [Lineolata rhizophorae]
MAATWSAEVLWDWLVGRPVACGEDPGVRGPDWVRIHEPTEPSRTPRIASQDNRTDERAKLRFASQGWTARIGRPACWNGGRTDTEDGERWMMRRSVGWGPLRAPAFVGSKLYLPGFAASDAGGWLTPGPSPAPALRLAGAERATGPRGVHGGSAEKRRDLGLARWGLAVAKCGEGSARGYESASARTAPVASLSARAPAVAPPPRPPSRLSSPRPNVPTIPWLPRSRPRRRYAANESSNRRQRRPPQLSPTPKKPPSPYDPRPRRTRAIPSLNESFENASVRTRTIRRPRPDAAPERTASNLFPPPSPTNRISPRGLVAAPPSQKSGVCLCHQSLAVARPRPIGPWPAGRARSLRHGSGLVVCVVCVLPTLHPCEPCTTNPSRRRATTTVPTAAARSVPKSNDRAGDRGFRPRNLDPEDYESLVSFSATQVRVRLII